MHVRVADQGDFREMVFGLHPVAGGAALAASDHDGQVGAGAALVGPPDEHLPLVAGLGAVEHSGDEHVAEGFDALAMIEDVGPLGTAGEAHVLAQGRDARTLERGPIAGEVMDGMIGLDVVHGQTGIGIDVDRELAGDEVDLAGGLHGRRLREQIHPPFEPEGEGGHQRGEEERQEDGGAEEGHGARR